MKPHDIYFTKEWFIKTATSFRKSIAADALKSLDINMAKNCFVSK